MKVNKSYYVIVGEDNNYYSEEYEWWFYDILEATKYDKWDEANELAENLDAKTASVQVTMEITIQE